jgi:hypothetical protein
MWPPGTLEDHRLTTSRYLRYSTLITIRQDIYDHYHGGCRKGFEIDMGLGIKFASVGLDREWLWPGYDRSSPTLLLNNAYWNLLCC